MVPHDCLLEKSVYILEKAGASAVVDGCFTSLLNCTCIVGTTICASCGSVQSHTRCMCGWAIRLGNCGHARFVAGKRMLIMKGGRHYARHAW